MVGGPLPGALATVDVSRDEPNTGAELSQESRTTYVTIVHRCSVSGEPPVLCTLLLMCLCTAFDRFVAVCWVCYSGRGVLRSSTGGRRAVYRTNISNSELYVHYTSKCRATDLRCTSYALPSSWPLTWAYPWAATKVDVEGSWPAVRPAGLHPVATRWHLSIEHPKSIPPSLEHITPEGRPSTEAGKELGGKEGGKEGGGGFSRRIL